MQLTMKIYVRARSEELREEYNYVFIVNPDLNSKEKTCLI